MTSKAQRNVCIIIATIALAFAFLGSGFAVCAGIPPVTETLAEKTSNEVDSPFTRDQLVEAAMATLTYTVTDNDYDALMDTIADINNQAGTPYAHVSVEELAAAPESYTLTPDAISHLDDVYNVVSRVMIPLIGVAAIAAFSLMYLAYAFGVRSIKAPLIISGGAVLVLFCVVGAWAAADFNGFFAAFHSLFFAEGTWTFSYDSLLICMYPQAFWVGMGSIWLATSILLSILSLACGLIMVLRDRRIRASRDASASAQAAA